MGILTALHHVTHYRYDRPITLGAQTIRLRPAPHTHAHIQSYSLNLLPEKHFINWQQDPFGNYLARVMIPEKTKEFRVEVDLVTEIKVFNPLDFFLDDYAMNFPFQYEAGLKEELAPYLEIKDRDAELMNWVASVDQSPRSIVNFLVDINQKLNAGLTYVIRLEAGIQTPQETLTLKSASCRDMAWLLCQALRHLGLATRFASGYLIQLKPDTQALDGPQGTDVDFTDLHAWTEVYLPGAGWIGLDATSGLFTGEGHIPLCCTPNPSSAAPISGTIEACGSTLTHEMTITRISEERRVTKPYTEEDWKKIDALGVAVDKSLAKQDVRLTMGGEPTFVSRDDRAGDEWHYSALSDKKYELGHVLFGKLGDHFAKGSLRQYTQGKWYPGEILPRWAMNCFWRRDGDAIWQDASLLADPQVDLKHDLKTAERFMAALAETLAIPASYVLPAQEDAPYYLWKEQRIPIEGEMLEADLFEQKERARLQGVMDANLNAPVGYVLPLSYSPSRKQWISNAWKFRSGHVMLIAGDSPVGLRLPLGALPVVSDKLAAAEYIPERSAFGQDDKLVKHAALGKKRGAASDAKFKNDPSGLVRSAVTAEIRGGSLHLFLPPLVYIEHFLELIAAIEATAAALKIPVVLEGYMPPADLRVRSFSVTPDPGVIEVNIQPAADWPELKDIVNTVYEEAHLSRLITDKFLLDGRRVGTGGGNHIVMGAASPKDSPFLRRPDVLRSLIAFWQNHPSLSYLFSGMYIGPTSQSPRIDEARHDSLYELELAFQNVPVDKDVPPWLVDRLFRNLLVDLTGNTHRAEFCIDKLYSPAGERGRLGLLEMRGFEMTPHPQMNLVQALLLRAAIAHFWKHPYHGELVRFGTQLHDQFMMPHYVWEDFGEVLKELNIGGFPFDAGWFEPFLDFRFPHYGTAQIGGVTLELRMALEPWPVMGEELNAQAVSRSVDSTVERLQVKVTGAIAGQHVVTCNGRRLPLHPTSEQGVTVAAVRYKAWAQPSSYHPNLPVDAPLVFDVIDARHGRSLGGCTYFVAHPGGRNYETLPINDNEAEGRRLSRFQAMGHRPGKTAVPPVEPNPDFPHTLDLRRRPN